MQKPVRSEFHFYSGRRWKNMGELLSWFFNTTISDTTYNTQGVLSNERPCSSTDPLENSKCLVKALFHRLCSHGTRIRRATRTKCPIYRVCFGC